MRSWSRTTGVEGGELVDVPTLWQLARRWYDDRLDRDWRRRTVPERQAILNAVGLTGPFWSLT